MANKIRDQKIRVIWAVILLAILVIFFATGCKPQQITERVITKVDSTSISHLTNELSRRENIIERLQTDLNSVREENSRLTSESSSHTINYDTTARVNPETGEYPKASETKTESRYLLEKTIKEMETLKQEHEKEIRTVEILNSHLQTTIKSLKQENSDLKTKSPAFNLKSFLVGFISGAIVLFVLLFIRKLS